jgi:hypothetical membrane protein
MNHTIFEIIGWGGALLLLAGYFLFSLGKFDKKLWAYHVFNFVSSFLLLINAIYTDSGPFILVNSVWCIIATVAYIKEKRKK